MECHSVLMSPQKGETATEASWRVSGSKKPLMAPLYFGDSLLFPRKGNKVSENNCCLIS